MTQVQILPPAAKFLKKLKDKKLKSLYKESIEMICEDYSIGEEKTGDLAGMYGTIGYEVICGISKRIPRVIYKGDEISDVVEYY